MKKILLVLTVIFASAFTDVSNNQIEEIEVTYNGQSEKAYYFTNKQTGKVMEFTIVSKKAVSKYDFNEKELIGKSFKITYEVDKVEIKTDDTQVKQYKQRLILIDINKI
ncbi:hypothetical protein [Aquimarina mytili]|uniref:Uncharacterized protein n=1 Tax=Aquimarina mytili TaxID=874423 RepID=A0A936ZQE3_9FLAO|nr:hypothetical protein [Aquimarina mytili]MBL0682387.1 hypothetical protein [Aquimarina mytili]